MWLMVTSPKVIRGSLQGAHFEVIVPFERLQQVVRLSTCDLSIVRAARIARNWSVEAARGGDYSLGRVRHFVELFEANGTEAFAADPFPVVFSASGPLTEFTSSSGTLFLVSGFHRCLAATLLDLPHVHAVVDGPAAETWIDLLRTAPASAWC